MKRLAWFPLIALLLSLSLPVKASICTYSVEPSISFYNNCATCEVIIDATYNDLIEATMELWRGTTKIDEWNDSDVGSLSMSETANVTRFKTYRLVVNYAVNGISKTPVEVSKYYG